jgi:hypothetical protein
VTSQFDRCCSLIPGLGVKLSAISAELRLANGVTLLGKFDGEFANRWQTECRWSAFLRWRWASRSRSQPAKPPYASVVTTESEVTEITET